MEMAESRSNSSALRVSVSSLPDLHSEVIPEVLQVYDRSDVTQKEEKPPIALTLAPSEQNPSLVMEEKADTTPDSCVTSEQVDYPRGDDEDGDNEKAKLDDVSKIPSPLVSFKEESNKVIDLSESERNALDELKRMVLSDFHGSEVEAQLECVDDAQANEEIPDRLSTTKSTSDLPPPSVKEEDQKDVSLWGIPLLEDDRSDVILLKYLRARDFSVKDAFQMLKNTIQWRKDFRIEDLIDEDLGSELEKVVFMYGKDKEGHPVCYNVYGEFQNKELYHETFSDAAKRLKFLKWRIQFLEKSIRKLDFHPGAVSTIFQVNDLKNSPGPGKRELRLATKQALHLLQDNYPEFVAKQVFINVPWWYVAFYTMVGPFMTQRTKRKFVFASPSRSVETLLKYIAPEYLPIRYGGLGSDLLDGGQFSVADPATSLSLKPATKHSVEIPVSEKCVVVWEMRVVGWEVSHGMEFVPDAVDAYTVIIQKPTKFLHTDAPVISNSFKVPDSGKLLLSVDNTTARKKELLYRFKIKPETD